MMLTPINQILIDIGKTQRELAAELGISVVNLNKTINCRLRNNPTRHKLSKFFNRPIRELFPEDAA